MDVLHAEVWRMFDDCMEVARDELESQLYGRYQINRSETLDRVTTLHGNRNALGLCRNCAAPSGGRARCGLCAQKQLRREKAKRQEGGSRAKKPCGGGCGRQVFAGDLCRGCSAVATQCKDCFKPQAVHRARCRACSDKHNQRERARRAARLGLTKSDPSCMGQNK